MRSELKISHRVGANIWPPWRIGLRQAILLSVLAVFSGCATYPNQQNPRLPAVAESLFDSCETGDGAMAMRAIADDLLVGVAEAEWLAQKGAWTLQLLSPLGQTILSLKHGNGGLALQGPLARQLPALATRKDGFLEVDGHFVGIKAAEIPCFLQGKLPSPWRSDLKAVHEDGLKQRFWFDDEERVVKVTAIRSSQRPDLRKFCAQIKWGSFLFRNKLLICREVTDKMTTTVSGIGAYRLEWVPL